MKYVAVRDLKGGELIRIHNGLGTVSTIRVNMDCTIYVETFGSFSQKTFNDPHEQVQVY